MENSSTSKASSKLVDAIKRLCGYTLKTDYSVKLEVCESDSSARPECSHSFTGSSQKSIVKTVAVVVAASMMICLISSLCSFFCNLSKLFKN